MQPVAGTPLVQPLMQNGVDDVVVVVVAAAVVVVVVVVVAAVVVVVWQSFFEYGQMLILQNIYIIFILDNAQKIRKFYEHSWEMSIHGNMRKFRKSLIANDQ